MLDTDTPEVVDEADEAPPEDEQQPTEQVEGEEAQGEDGAPEADSPDDDEGDELVVTIGDEAASEPQPETDQFRQLRQAHRDKAHKVRQLEAEIARLRSTQAPAQIELGAKPTLEGCGYDEAKLDTELERWYGRKQAIDAKKREAEQAQAAADAQWAERQADYAKAKAKLSTQVRDFEEAEAAVTDSLSVVQQSILLHGSKQPAILILALGRDQKRLKELTQIQDPIKFAVAAAEIHSMLKIAPKKTTPAPERVLQSSAGAQAGAGRVMDKRLEQMRQKAESTGDYTAYFAAKRQVKEAGQRKKA